MARKSECKYWASRRAYCTRINGTEHVLAPGPKDEPDGPTYTAALARLAELLRDNARLEPGDVSLRALAERYAQSLERQGRTGTLRVTKSFLTGLVERHGQVRGDRLAPAVLETWFAEQEAWGPATRVAALGRLLTVLNWAVRKRFISSHLLGQVDKSEFGQLRARGREFVLKPALMDLLIAEAQPAFAAFLRALRLTGARPGEVANAEARHFRPEVRAIVFPWNPTEGYVWKCARKTEKDRVIFLPGSLVAEVEARIKVQGDGYIWRPANGGHWRPSNNAAKAWTRLRARKRVQRWLADNKVKDEHVIMYGFRHTLITEMLNRHISVKVLADLMGTSATMIERHYGHLDADLARLRMAFTEFNPNA